MFFKFLSLLEPVDINSYLSGLELLIEFYMEKL
jgi:hypothetical protein